MSFDGGYYAIKGFEFQIDKSICEILDLGDENTPINIENIQDLDSDNFVMQVKYKETQHYADIQIREPVIQLIEEFKNDPTKKYILYCHFSDKKESTKTLSVSELNSILTLSTGSSLKAQRINQAISSFDDEIKNKFVAKFEIIFAPEHSTQLERLLKLISQKFNIGFEDSVFIHGNLSYYLRLKALTDKVCTKKDLAKFISDGRKLVFTAEFKNYKGDEAYFRFIKSKHFTNGCVDDFERFIILEISESESVAEIKEAILKLKNKFYKKTGGSRKVIKSGAPYIYLQDISEEKLAKLKKELFQEGLKFKDGHDFLNSEFCIESLKERSTIHNNVCIKFINSLDYLNALLNDNLGKTKIIYQFFMTKPTTIQHDIKNVKIQIDDLSEILSII